MKPTNLCIAAFTLVSIGCGNSNSAPVTPVNQGPIFTSSTSETISENTSGTIYTAIATDNDGGTITYSLASSSDGPLFNIDTNTGALAFINAPDFESPEDSGQDNIYNLTIIANDGQGSQPNLDVAITVTDIDQPFTIRRVGTGFNQPLYVTPLPDGTNRVLVLEKTGRIRILDPDTQIIDSVDFLDISSDIDFSNEGGLLGMEFAPDFETSGAFFLNVTSLSFDTEIRKYETVSGRQDIGDPVTKDVILTFDQPFRNHNAGWIGFDNNGYLIIPTGDGGSGGDPNNFAQNPQSLLGKVLRIDVNTDDFPADDLKDYSIPSGNTYTNIADGLPEIFAIGLRNPFRCSFDPITGDLLIADVGQNAAEEVSRLPMNDSSLNFGWNIKEGNLDFQGSTTATLTPPITEYFHGSGPTEGRSITGGYVYNGPVEALQNEYIFADFASDNIWSVPVTDLQNGSTVSSSEYNVQTTDFIPDQGTLNNITSFGLDQDKNLYITTLGGDVFRLEAE